MAQRNDIRVRLTPEGVTEVVRSLREVSKEAGAANKLTTGLLSSIRGLLPTLGFTAVVAGFTAITRGAVDFADEVGKAGVRTGSSAENFSVLAFAAKTANIQFSELLEPIAKVAQVVEQFKAGTLAGGAAQALGDLGLAAKDFEGLDSAQSFGLISERIVAIDGASRRTAASMGVLGEQGAKLLPLMADLGEKGFAQVAKDAEAAGAIISTDLALASAAANDSLTSLGIQVQGLALQFLGGFVPSVNTALATFREDVEGKGVAPMKTFGEVSGRAFRIIVAGSRLLAGGVSAAFTIVGESLGGVAAQLEGFLTGGIAGFRRAREAVKQGLGESLSAAASSIERDYIGLLDAFDTRPIEIKVRPTVDQSAVDETARDAEQQIQQRLAALSKQVGDADIKGLSDSAKQRRQIAEESLKLDQDRAQAQLASQQQSLAGQRALASAESQILAERVRVVTDSFRTEQALIEGRNNALAAAARKQYGDSRANAQLQTAIAQQSTNEQIALAQKYYGDLAKLQGEYLNRYRTAQEAIRALDQQTADNKLRFESVFTDAIRSRQTAEQRAAEDQRRGFELVRQLRSAVLANDFAQVQKLNDELLKVVQTLANTQGYEGIAEQIKDDAVKLNQLASDVQRDVLQKSAQEAKAATKSLDTQLADALRSVKDLQKSLTEGLSVKIDASNESLRKLVDDVRRALEEKPFQIRIAPQVQGAGPSAPGFASGGYVPGSAPHPRADNMLARVTSGEFIHQVAAVRHYGVDFMRDVNSLRFPRFADGGLVGGESAESARDVVDVNLSVGGQTVRMQSEREQVRALVTALRGLQGGIAG
jgi:hypothetical protein